MTKSILSNALMAAMACLSLCVSCSEDPITSGNNGNSDWNPGGGPGGNGGGPGGSGSSSGLIDFGTLSNFTVELNTATLTESETLPTDESDTYYTQYLETNFSAKSTTDITFCGTGDATISGLVKGDTISVTGGHVVVHAHSKGLTLHLAGSTTDGSLTVYSEKKFCLALDNTTVCNPAGAAINIQNGNCFVTLTGSNTLSDAASASYAHPDEEDMKAVFFSEDDLRFSGTGLLNITAQNSAGKSCLASDDMVFIRPNTQLRLTSASGAGHAIKANDAIVVQGGVQNIQVAGAGKKGFSTDGYAEVCGGRTTIITTGGVDASDATDPTGCAAIKCDSLLQVSGGELWLKSTGQGGKGLSADMGIAISGADLYIITEGSQYGSSGNSNMGPWGGNQSSSANSVSPKAIRCDADINISGGNIYVRTAGTNAEGIESKATLTICGGNVAALAYDDGFNAQDVTISGGKALAVSTGNCDGIDSNGNITATGGVLIGVASTTNSEDGIDLENTLMLSNATVIGISAGGMGSGKVSGRYVSTTVSGTAGDYVTLASGSTPLVTFRLPRTYSNGQLLLSAPQLSSGTCSLLTGVTPTGGTLWMNNYLDGCTSVSGGSSSVCQVL